MLTIKKIKPFVFPVICLILADQIAKMIVSRFFMKYEFDIISNLIRFRPIQNTNLSYGGNFIDILSNFWVLILLNIFVLFVFVSGYLLYKQKRKTASISVKVVMIFGLSGSLCSLIDKVFWGGSIDFIQIPNFFTFDFKDCYLLIAEIMFIILAVIHNKEISVKEYLRFCCSRFR